MIIIPRPLKIQVNHLCHGALTIFLCCAIVSCVGEPLSVEAENNQAGQSGHSGTGATSGTASSSNAAGTSSVGGSGANSGGSGGISGSAGSSSAGSGGTPPPSCDSLDADRTGIYEESCVIGGEFSMGSTTASPSGAVLHSPAHQVSVSTFYLDRYEVTVGRYRECVESGTCLAVKNTAGCSYYATEADDSRAMNCLSYDDAVAFCAWDGGRRLPTEAEWEYAARSSASTTYPWGELVADCNHAIIGSSSICKQYSTQYSESVGILPLGEGVFGQFDLIGNVSEWVADYHSPYTSDAQEDPTGPANGTNRVIRGGSFQSLVVSTPSYIRYALNPAVRATGVGARCARNAE